MNIEQALTEEEEEEKEKEKLKKHRELNRRPGIIFVSSWQNRQSY